MNDELLLTPEERNACAERGEKRWTDDGKKGTYTFNCLWQYVVDEVVIILLAKVKQHYAQADRLAELLEEPRAIRLLAEWLAIDHNETRLQYEKYMESAQELYDYITVIVSKR